MAAFKDVPAKITMKDLTHQEIDKQRKEMIKSKSLQPANFFRQQNCKVIKLIAKDAFETEREIEKKKIQDQERIDKRQGKMPAYLLKFKQDAEKDRLQT